MGVDAATVVWLNSFVGQLPWLDRVVALVVNDYFVPTTIGLLLVVLWFSGRSEAERERGQRAVAMGAVGLGFANLIIAISNYLYFRPRPFEAHELNLLFYLPPDSSFPSTPAAAGLAVAVGIIMTRRRLGTAMLVLAILWSTSRVYAGVQYPSDIVAGAAIGAVCAVLARGFLRLLEPGPSIVLNLWRRLYLA